MLINWVAVLEPLARAGWHWGVDGKFKMVKGSQPYDTPWLHAPVPIPGTRENDIDCGLLTIYHNYVFQQKAAHTFCMNCYKVVVMPETLEQVHKIAEWQHDLGVACKVGAERRNYTQRKWGAYFYCRGVEEGRERYKMVRKWVDENLGEHIKVILKRACTEFEQHMGDSDKWEMVPNQEAIEKEGAEEIFGYKPISPFQAEAIKHHVWDVWDAWDKDNKPPVTYHEEEKVEE
jgi:RNase P subunit RPR2